MLSQIGWILFALFLYLLCAFLLVLEVFIPSLGLLTLLSLGALAWGVYIFFQVGLTAGWLGVATAVIMVPVVWIITYKLFPHTKIGKTMLLGKVDRALGDAIPDRDDLQCLQGCKGVTLGPLRPVGICRFEGKRVACLAETGFIDRQTPVQVIRVEGNKVTVQIITTEEKES